MPDRPSFSGKPNPTALAATDFESFISGRRAFLDERLALIDAKANGGLLPDVTIDKGVLKITPIAKSTPPEAEALAARLYAMLPRVRITDLLSEVARWTLFPDCFTHLRTGEIVGNPQILMASLLAEGLNLGLTRMAEACGITTLGQLAWTSEWYIRDETYALALQRLVNQQQRAKHHRRMANSSGPDGEAMAPARSTQNTASTQGCSSIRISPISMGRFTPRSFRPPWVRRPMSSTGFCTMEPP